MADAAGAGAAVPAPLIRGLPDEITIWEILVRLPPKALLRCRAVCPAWRSATSTRDFLLAHHHHQPTLPLLHDYSGGSLDIIHLDHRTGIAAAADHLQSVARFCTDLFHVEASCDGLLVLSLNCVHISICNPATRQYADLPLLRGFMVLGMYMYSPTCEYRLLLYPNPMMRHVNLLPDTPDGYYVFTIGSVQPPRQVRCPDAERLVRETISVLFHGSMHWYTGQVIMAFDITSELFRQMRSPIVSSKARLFEIGGVFGVSRLQDEAATATMEIWVMQDYESVVWALKHRVEFPVADLTLRFGVFHDQWSVVVPSGDGELLVLLSFRDWLLQMDIGGKLVASFHRKYLSTTQVQLKQTLVPQTFFPTLEGYVVNTSPFT